MARREFSRRVKAEAFLRADGRCEGTRADGKPCRVHLSFGKYAYDHDLPDWLGGEPTLENCRVICLACHAEKTKGDRARIDKAKRQRDYHIGAKAPPRRPFPGSKASGLKKGFNGVVERRT